MKAKSLMYEITYEVPTASGNAVWHSVTVPGNKKIDIINLCNLYSYKLIGIRKMKCYI